MRRGLGRIRTCLLLLLEKKLLLFFALLGSNLFAISTGQTRVDIASTFEARKERKSLEMLALRTKLQLKSGAAICIEICPWNGFAQTADALVSQENMSSTIGFGSLFKAWTRMAAHDTMLCSSYDLFVMMMRKVDKGGELWKCNLLGLFDRAVLYKGSK